MTVAALLADDLARTSLRDALRGRAALMACSRFHELLAVLKTCPVDLVVVTPWDASGARVAPVLSLVKDRLPSVPIAIYCMLTPDAAREIVALTKAGADEVVLRAADDHVAALWSRLLVTTGRRAADEVLEALHAMLPPEIEAIACYCLHRAGAGPSVAEVAAAFHIHRKTLVNRMAAAGLPPPGCLISWCRLLLAARLLEDRGRAVERVALELGFGSGAALRNMLRRYTGLRPSELREHGGMRCLLERFRQSAIRSPARPA